MTILDSITLGIVEGITEFLPISSTGHLILVSTLLGIPQTDFLKTFQIAIQLGAICSVIFLFWRSFLDIDVLKRLAAAFVPTAIIGFLMYNIVKDVFLESPVIVVWALLLGGVALIVLELLHKENESASEKAADISYTQSALIGVFQSLAMVPGVSRSAATIVGGLLIGVRRVAIVEFSFLLAVPTMLAATGYDIMKNASLFSPDNTLSLATGFITAFIVALFVIKFLLSYIKTHSFIGFGIYRIVIAALFFLFVL
ncbi:undecaprenyl-diphosphatase UppP [Candidatus Parcubacteria bacterium]|nr:MAG: undecaprenyl-diphosphatase UppP [Candidatus Parcubacteria bacterium]